MLSFKQFFLLTENKIEFLKKVYKDDNFDLSHDPHAQHSDNDAIIDHLATADPTSKNKYTQWIVKQYRKGNFKQGDVDTVKGHLANFETYKNRLEKKDIGQYKHINDLTSALTPHIGTEADKSNRQKKKEIKHEGADAIINNDHLSVFKLKTREAAEYYGANTRWCTAGKVYNRFDSYNREGPLYVFHSKKTGKKYQLHFPTGQFMNEANKADHPWEIIKHHPEITSIPEFHNKGPNWLDFEPEEARMAKFHDYSDNYNRNAAIETMGSMPREHLDEFMDHPNVNTRRAVLKNPSSTKEHALKALNDIDGTIRAQAYAHKHLPMDHLNQLMNDYHSAATSNERRSHIFHASQNPNLTDEHISTFLSHNPAYDRNYEMVMAKSNVATHPNLKAHHITNFLNTHGPEESQEARTHMILHPNAEKEHLIRVVSNKDESTQVQASALTSHKVDHDVLDAAIHPRLNYYSKEELLQHHKLSADNISKAIRTFPMDGVVIGRLTEHPNTNASHLHSMISHFETNSHFGMDKILEHPLADKSHFQAAMEKHGHHSMRRETIHRIARGKGITLD